MGVFIWCRIIMFSDVMSAWCLLRKGKFSVWLPDSSVVLLSFMELESLLNSVHKISLLNPVLS